MRHQHQTIASSIRKVEEILGRNRTRLQPCQNAELSASPTSRIAAALRAGVACVILGLLAVRAFCGAGGNLAVAANEPCAYVSYHGFKADWIDDVIDVIEDIVNGGDGGDEEPQKTAETAIDDGLVNLNSVIQQSGAIAPDIKPWAAAVLNYVEDDIETAQQILFNAKEPYAASAQPSAPAAFGSLEECAAQCLAWAHEAKQEMQRPMPNRRYVYDTLQLIRNALPQYRALAGIQ